MHTKTSAHAHTCTLIRTHTHINFNFPQLNSIPDVLVVDRGGGKKNGRTTFSKTHTHIKCFQLKREEKRGEEKRREETTSTFLQLIYVILLH